MAHPNDDTQPDGAIVSAHGVNFWFGDGRLHKQTLFDVGFDIGPGEVVLLTGESGSGKTTLLTLVGALRTLASGRLRVLGRELLGADAATRVSVRRRIGFIFQAHNLIPHLSALDNVRLALELHLDVGPAEGRERAADLLDAVGVGSQASAYPDALSGGQKQRVAVARALVGRPDLILADEPTSALDGKTGRGIVERLVELARAAGCRCSWSHTTREFSISPIAPSTWRTGGSHPTRPMRRPNASARTEKPPSGRPAGVVTRQTLRRTRYAPRGGIRCWQLAPRSRCARVLLRVTGARGRRPSAPAAVRPRHRPRDDPHRAVVRERVTWTNRTKSPVAQLAFHFYPHYWIPPHDPQGNVEPVPAAGALRRSVRDLPGQFPAVRPAARRAPARAHCGWQTPSCACRWFGTRSETPSTARSAGGTCGGRRFTTWARFTRTGARWAARHTRWAWAFDWTLRFSDSSSAPLRFDVAKSLNGGAPVQFWFGAQHPF